MKLLLIVLIKSCFILFNNKFDFNEHFTSLCRASTQKINALARLALNMNLAQRRLIIIHFSAVWILPTVMNVSCEETKQLYKQYP